MAGIIHPLEQVWPAVYFDGRRPLRRAVELRLTERGILLGDTGAFWPWEELRRVSGDHESEPLTFERAGTDPPESIVVDDHRFLAAVRQYAPNIRRSWAREPAPMTATSVLLAAVSVIALGVVFYFWGPRLLAGALVNAVPVDMEAKFGEAVMNALAPEASRCTDPALGEALTTITDRLTAAAGRQPYTFHVAVSRNSMINAMAAPGGHIVVFSGLIEHTGAPEELAGVLAHEMQHVMLRHTTRAIIAQFGAKAVLAMLTGDTGSGSGMVQSAAMLVDLHYARSDEQAADDEGVALLRRARIDPRALASFFETLERAGPDVPAAVQYLSTHPATADRVESIRRAAGSTPPEASPLLPDADWATLRNACTAYAR